jgi:hypothetical protein
MIDMEGTHDNDDEKLTFITLSAATQNVICYLKLRNDLVNCRACNCPAMRSAPRSTPKADADRS